MKGWTLERSPLPPQPLVVYPHRYRRRRALIGFVLSLLVALSVDVFVVWNFGVPPDRTPESNIAALAAFLFTLLVGWMGWFCVVSWRKWQSDQPLLMIDAQGMHIRFLRGVDNVLLPWEEIEWIAVSPIGDTYLSLSLKDARRWWTMYGKRKPRVFRRDPLTHAHLNLGQTGVSLPVKQILHFIEQNYAQELVFSNSYLQSD